uniref:Uncharacterized protein n=1 Tax=Alexandrium monilatum TaxID=311494 RepID=A0A7S4R4L4_9DINO
MFDDVFPSLAPPPVPEKDELDTVTEAAVESRVSHHGDNIRLRDINIIVIGTGPTAVRLVERRRQAGGRVCWLHTQDKPLRSGPWAQVVSQAFVDAASDERVGGIATGDAWDEPLFEAPTFAWAPPRVQDARDPSFHRRRRQFSSSVLEWRTGGPHIVHLRSDEAYRIVHGARGRSPGIQVVDMSQADFPRLRWAVSGIVLFEGSDATVAPGVETCPDDASANLADVAVHCEEAKPLAVVRPGHVAVWVPAYFLQYVLYYVLMAVYEPGVRPGQVPWWRGSFAVFLVGPVGYATFPDFMGVALTGHAIPGVWPRLVAGATLLISQTAWSITPLGWIDGEWCALPIFGAVSAAFLPYFLIAAPLHVWLTRKKRRTELVGRSFPWVQHSLWLVWMIFGTFGTWLVLYGAALAFLSMSKWSPMVASTVLTLLTSAVELGTACGTVFLYDALVYGPRIRSRMGSRGGRAMLGDQRELLILPIAITHAYAEGCRLVSLLATTATQPSWIWVAQLLGCNLTNIVVRLTLPTELMSRVLPSCCQCLFAPDAGTGLLNEVKLCFGYPRFISLAALVVANFMRSGFSAWPLFNKHATLLVLCAPLTEAIEDFIVTSRLARCLSWKHRMSPYYHGMEPLGTGQLLGFDRNAKLSSGPAINFSGVRFVRFRVVVVAVAASSFFPYTLLTLLLGAGFVHGACSGPIGEEDRIVDGLIWHSPLRC